MQIAENVIRFTLGGLLFEYDPEKNRKNIENTEKHGISFKSAARVFFGYDRIEFYDDAHSKDEDRYNTIGDVSVGSVIVIGNLVLHPDCFQIGTFAYSSYCPCPAEAGTVQILAG